MKSLDEALDDLGLAMVETRDAMKKSLAEDRVFFGEQAARFRGWRNRKVEGLLRRLGVHRHDRGQFASQRHTSRRRK